MSLSQRKHKGIVLTISSVIEGFVVIAAFGFLFWLFWNKMIEIHTSVDEFTTERHTIGLANALLSSEKIVYEKDGKIMRGILDAKKLDSLFEKKNDFLSNVKIIVNPKDLGLSYPNSLAIVVVEDLEKCNNGNCEGWIVRLDSPIYLKGLSLVKFVECLTENIKIDLGMIFRWIVSPLGLWQPWDIEKCVKNNVPPSIKSVFSKSEITSEGFPVLIKYDNEVHIGRIIVWLGEFL